MRQCGLNGIAALLRLPSFKLHLISRSDFNKSICGVAERAIMGVISSQHVHSARCLLEVFKVHFLPTDGAKLPPSPQHDPPAQRVRPTVLQITRIIKALKIKPCIMLRNPATQTRAPIPLRGARCPGGSIEICLISVQLYSAPITRFQSLIRL